jgi:hypothetical protein
MSSDKRQVRLIRPSKHQAREAWLTAREVRRACDVTVSRLIGDLKAAKDAQSHAREVEEDNAAEWESLLLDERPELADTMQPGKGGDVDPLR